MGLSKFINVYNIKSYLALSRALITERRMLEVTMRGVLTVLMIILLLPAASFADGGKTYFELKAGQFKGTGDLSEENAPNGSNIEFSVGHRFFKYFAAEVSYGRYRIERDVDTFVIQRVGIDYFYSGHETLNVYPLLVSGKFLYPVEDGFFYVGGGYGRYQVVDLIEMEEDSASLGHREDDVRANDTVNGYHLMLGAMYDINSSWTVGFEYKRVMTEEAELKDHFFGDSYSEKTDVDGRMISGMIQLRF
jgi:opacity protein-like surface antigen